MRVNQPGILLLVLCGHLPGIMIPQPNLAKRIESAEIIVVAKMASGTSLASGSHISSDIVLHIDRVFKGALTPGSEISAHLEGQGFWDVPSAKQSTLNDHVFGIWFLKSEGQSYSVVSRDGRSGELFIAPVTLPEETPAAAHADNPATSVLNELASALRWIAEKQNGRLDPKAEHEGTPDERKAAELAISQWRSLSDDLRSMDPATTHSVYREFAADQSGALRALGVQGLIAENDPEGINRAAANWSDLVASADINPIIASLMGYSNPNDAVAVRALGTLALRDPAEVSLRENASYSLRVIHTKEAVPSLIGLLGFKDERIRINALSGLCLFVRNAPTVTPQAVVSMSWMQSRLPAPMLNEETQSHCFMGGTLGHVGDLESYVTFWNSWWAQHRTEIQEN
jgi:hypothetical protein